MYFCNINESCGVVGRSVQYVRLANKKPLHEGILHTGYSLLAVENWVLAIVFDTAFLLESNYGTWVLASYMNSSTSLIISLIKNRHNILLNPITALLLYCDGLNGNEHTAPFRSSIWGCHQNPPPVCGLAELEPAAKIIVFLLGGSSQTSKVPA